MAWRALTGTLVGILTTATVALSGAAPASAKPLLGVSVTVPGGEPMELASYGHHSDGSVWELAESLGLWEALGSDGAPELTLDPPAGTDRLGPRFTVTWTLGQPGEPDPSGGVLVEPLTLTQELYPQAVGGPVVYTPAGQRHHGGVTDGGWIRPPDWLPQRLARLGFETKWRDPTAPSDSTRASADRSAAAGPAEEDDDRPVTASLALAAVVVLAVTVAACWLTVAARRRAAVAGG